MRAKKHVKRHFCGSKRRISFKNKSVGVVMFSKPAFGKPTWVNGGCQQAVAYLIISPSNGFRYYAVQCLFGQYF
jgi:hypothetical protein